MFNQFIFKKKSGIILLIAFGASIAAKAQTLDTGKFALTAGLEAGFVTGAEKYVHNSVAQFDLNLNYALTPGTIFTFTSGYGEMLSKPIHINYDGYIDTKSDVLKYIPLKVGVKFFMSRRFYFDTDAGVLISYGVQPTGNYDSGYGVTSLIVGPSFGYAKSAIDVGIRYEFVHNESYSGTSRVGTAFFAYNLSNHKYRPQSSPSNADASKTEESTNKFNFAIGPTGGLLTGYQKDYHSGAIGGEAQLQYSFGRLFVATFTVGYISLQSKEVEEVDDHAEFGGIYYVPSGTLKELPLILGVKAYLFKGLYANLGVGVCTETESNFQQTRQVFNTGLGYTWKHLDFNFYYDEFWGGNVTNSGVSYSTNYGIAGLKISYAIFK